MEAERLLLRSNVANLKVAREADTGPAPRGGSTGGMEVTLIMIGDSLHICNGTDAVIAYDAETGQRRWTLQMTNSSSGKPCGGVICYRAPGDTATASSRGRRADNNGIARKVRDEHSSSMPIGRSDLADFSYFLAIARHRSFRRAGLEVGVSASALSHALKGLEARLGIRLLNRTNRSVTLTAAGKELQDAISQPFAAIDQAVDRLNRFRDAPTGRIRLNVPTDAASLLLAPVLPAFVDRYPDIEIDLAVNNHMVDVTEGGFDAGIRYGGTMPEDMVAQRLSADIRWVVAGSPAYLDRFGVPERPEDLMHHRCLRFRLGDDSIYRWEFERGAETLNIAAPGSLVLDDGPVILALLTRGAGLMYGPEPLLAPLIASGDARLVLEDWASPGPGFHIYYSSRRQLPTGLRLLIDLIREIRPLGL